jgi:hypothetical protein
MKTYKVAKPLPDGLGSIIVNGAIYNAGMELPNNIPSEICEDYLQRELIVESATAQKKTPYINPEWRKRLKPISKWNINPADLIGKTLMQLNIMILEKDESLEPFDSMDDAIEYLSKDYEG